jgi:hypothetical protein
MNISNVNIVFKSNYAVAGFHDITTPDMLPDSAREERQKAIEKMLRTDPYHFDEVIFISMDEYATNNRAAAGLHCRTKVVRRDYPA